MSPDDFLRDVVEPNIADFTRSDEDVRHAFNVVASIDAFAAQIYWWAKNSAPAAVAGISDDTGFREKLVQRHEDFALLRDIAKAQKHVRLTRGNPKITGADQVSSRAIGYGEGPFGHGRWGGPPQVVVDQVVVDVDARSTRYVLQLVHSSLDF